jgi:hypothetical protein
MAMRASVTVSIAEDKTGIFIEIDCVTIVRVSAVDGMTAEAAGTSRTSSKVRASRISISISLEGIVWHVAISWILGRGKS